MEKNVPIRYEGDECCVGKSGFVSYTKHIVKATNTDLLHSLKITCNLELQNKEQKAYLGAMKFKTKILEILGKLLIFTPIPLNAQEVWPLNQFPMRE